MEDYIRTLLNAIPPVEKGEKVVLGIDGLSRSGKTSFVKKIEQHLQGKNIPICTFHIDEYIVEIKRRYDTDYEEW